MRLVITKSYEESARLAAEMMLAAVREKPDALLGLATGSTPIPVYENMVRAAREGSADFSRVSTINLDEYVGLCGDDPNSYLYFMKTNLFDGCRIPLSRVMIPDGAADPEKELVRMNTFADAHMIDVQLLSVGVNGHIGFNEPADRFFDKYHVVALTKKTRESNSRLFRTIDEVPRSAVTMGVGGIMRAKKIVFLATGDLKLDAMRRMLEDGDVTPQNQGTILKFHQDCTVFLDRAVADRIRPAGYIETVRT